MISFVEAVLHGADKSNPLNEKEVVEGLHPNAALMTEKELKALVSNWFLVVIDLQLKAQFFSAY